MAIAQMNWGKLRFSLEDIRMSEFANALSKVYSLAESHPGFIWRIPDNHSELQLADLGFDKLLSATISVWTDINSLKDYTYNSMHGSYLKRSSEWFQAIDGPQLVIWDVKNNNQPTFRESFERLDYLKNNGTSSFAYGWEK